MSARHLLALTALALWCAGGCAAILGVDSDDYADAAALACSCAIDNKDACAAAVEKAISKDKELEQIALDCLESTDATCGEIASCLIDSGYCAKKVGQSCLKGKSVDILGCCADKDLQCGDDNKCCLAPDAECTAPGSVCCAGQICGDEGTCVPAPAECAVLGESCQLSRDCCDGANCLGAPRVCSTNLPD